MKWNSLRRWRWAVLLTMFSLQPAWIRGTPANPADPVPRFTITFSDPVHQGPITGRVFVALTKNETVEPRLLIGEYRVRDPFFSADVERVQPGELMVLDSTSAGYPLDSLNDLPPGEYRAQALLNIYTEFNRADGHTVWAHMDQGEGQLLQISPGNLYSEVQKVILDPARGFDIHFDLNKVIPPIPERPDTPWIKHIRIQSALLTKWWGGPMYLGASILLPKGYDEHPDVRYPVLYYQGHFVHDAHFFFSTEDAPETPEEREVRTGRGPVETPFEFHKQWTSDDFPRMFLVAWQHPTPFYDCSYAVNSANIGPYGDAIMNELIPYIETRFRIIRQPYARMLTGGSTGGWESLALQVYHPDFFGGTWTFNPDPVDFRRCIVSNIYEDGNAFYPPGFDLAKPERPFYRDPKTGQEIVTMRQLSQMEAALGSRGRSGHQLDIWNAVYGPVGPDGYPKELWDKRTGKIDHEVAAYWRDNGYDLTDYLRRNWPAIGPKLKGKIHVWCPDMEDYYLNLSVYLLDEFLTGAVPAYGGSFHYARPPKGHGWRPMSNADMFRGMAEQIALNSPEWKY